MCLINWFIYIMEVYRVMNKIQYIQEGWYWNVLWESFYIGDF